jgi:protease I
VPVADRRLAGKCIAIFVEEGFSSRELLETKRLVESQAASTIIIGPSTKIAFRDKTGAESVTADLAAHAARAADFDALIIPGGHAPDRIRMRHAMVEFAQTMIAQGKPVAAICHGPQVLITANVLKGRTLTCWPSIAVDVKNAGGLYVDRPAVRDGWLITGRKGDDVPAVVEVLIAALTEPPARHAS